MESEDNDTSADQGMGMGGGGDRSQWALNSTVTEQRKGKLN